MYYLIDFENVAFSGFEGSQFLQKDDHVEVFYSSVCDKLPNYIMENIYLSGCTFEICRLQNVRKNALDFYIASRVGEIFALDKEANVAIISKDKDHQATLDYWRPRLKNKGQLIKAATIGKAMCSDNSNLTRKEIVLDKMQMVDLEIEYSKYKEREKIVETVTEVFSGTEYENMVSEISNIIIASNKPKRMYVTSLKLFGKKDGIEVYRKIKDVVVS